MAFAHTKNSRLFANTQHVSGSVSGYSASHTREMGTVTSLLDTGYKSIPGLRGGSLQIRGMFNSAAGDLHSVISAVLGVDNALLTTLCPDGTAHGQPAIITVSDPSGYDIPANTSDAVAISVDCQPDDGVDFGWMLHDHTAETADGNGSSLDGTTSSANGAVASLHLTAYSGLTNIIVTVQHSTDNSVWTDLITFTTATAVTSERKTVTGTVNRYVRALWDVTGSGSATFVVAFARL